MPEDNLKRLDSHFAFGENWASFARQVDGKAIKSAERGLLKLIPGAGLKGRSFLDIGSGSGVHALAAARCGAGRILALDIDPVCVATTRSLLENHDVAVPWDAQECSVFDLSAQEHGTFDIVYSWGVLHHSGAMVTAIRKAASLVKPDGLFVIALYRRTRLDRLWIAEKKWYANASQEAQRRALKAYDIAYRTASKISGKGTLGLRGMDYLHDLHDWLGGYPYEAILAPEVDELLTEAGLRKERVFARPISLGLFGSGCDEYVYRRNAD